MNKKSLGTVPLALVALSALVFVVPAGAKRVDTQVGESIPISIKPWAYGFYGRAPIVEVRDRACVTADREVAIYEMTGDHPDPAVDHKVAESVRDGDPRDWSMRGVDPGRRYYAEVPALTKPRCVGGRSEVVTAPSAPKPDEQAPRCAPGVHVECFYDLHGTLDSSTRKSCGEGFPKNGGYLCYGEYRRPDGTMAKFRLDIDAAPGFPYFVYLETMGSASSGDWAKVNGNAKSLSGDTYAVEQYCSGSPPACPNSIYPPRGEPGSRGGFLELTQIGAKLEIRGYAQG